MTQYSDASQKAALDAAIRCLKFNERPRAAERELLVLHLEFVKSRISGAEDAKRDARRASQRERQSDVGDVYREETARR